MNDSPKGCLTVSEARKRVVIVGAGFGGLWAARELARHETDVFLLDRNNFHTFFPLLYQVGAAEVEPEDIAYPIRTVLRRRPNARFALVNVEGVDLHNKTVRGGSFQISYDYLILALGSEPHFFGTPGAVEHAFPLRTMDHGIALRNHILSCFEKAAQEQDAEIRRGLLTFAIVGAGPTGVEFSGALAELIHGPLRKDFASVNFDHVKIVLVEAAPDVVPGQPGAISRYAQDRLHRRRVEVRLNTKVERIEADRVHLSGGETLPTHTVVWTAGVKGSSQASTWGLPTARNGCVKVAPTLQVPEHPEVYVIGDLAHVEEDGRPLPMIAPVAIQQGRVAARNIVRQFAGLPTQPFRYRDPGWMAVIGRNAAVARLGGRSFTGFPAWVIWLTVHLFKLIGFRNRLVVLLNWAWDYLFFERTVRLILPSKKAE